MDSWGGGVGVGGVGRSDVWGQQGGKKEERVEQEGGQESRAAHLHGHKQKEEGRWPAKVYG